MKGFLLISHGFYSRELKESLKMIAGPVTNIYAACLESTDGPDEFKAKIQALEPELAQYDEVIIFADLFGGSPCNTTFAYLAANPKYQFITGMNFPLILTALLNEEADLAFLIEQGKEAIINVREFSASMRDDDED